MMHLFSITYNCKEMWVIAPDKETAIKNATAYYAHLGKSVKAAHLYVHQMTYQKTPMRVDGFHRENDKLLFTIIVDDKDVCLDEIRFGALEE